MIEGNSAYKHGKCERQNWLKSLHVMSSFKAVAMQDVWQADHMKTTDWTDPYVTHKIKNNHISFNCYHSKHLKLD